jgi:site-specific DNA-cytosine methylase
MQPENQNDSVQLSTRYQQYDFAKRHLGGFGGRQIFPIGSGNSNDTRKVGKGLSATITRDYYKGLCGSNRQGVKVIDDFYPDRIREFDNCPTLRKDRQGLKVSFCDFSKQEFRLTENARTIQARYNKGYSHRKAEVSRVAIFDTDKEPEYNGVVNNKLQHYDSNKTRRPEEEVSALRKTTDTQEVQKSIGGLESLSESEILQLGVPQGDNAQQVERECSTKGGELSSNQTIPEKRNMRDLQVEKENGDSSQEWGQNGQQTGEPNGDMPRLPHNEAPDGSKEEKLGQQETQQTRSFRIRRLTPLEAERLMGLPDGWTEGVSDTQKYKLCGNGVVVNVVEEIIKRLLWTKKEGKK